MSYLLKTSFHQDEFQKHLKVSFTIKQVAGDGNCGYHSILTSLTTSSRCKKTYDCLSLRRDMFNMLSSGIFIIIFKHSMAHLHDLNE